MTDHDTTIVTDFFAAYAEALLARDERAIAGMYSVPALILFPGESIAVKKQKQTEQFFASGWEQYRGITAAVPDITVMRYAPGSIWVDVAWTYGGAVQERFCYQLVEREQGWQIAVLTPLEI